MDTEIYCPICYEDLTEGSECMLSVCGHSFCKECLRSNIKSAIKYVFHPKCPLDNNLIKNIKHLNVGSSSVAEENLPSFILEMFEECLPILKGSFCDNIKRIFSFHTSLKSKYDELITQINSFLEVPRSNEPRILALEYYLRNCEPLLEKISKEIGSFDHKEDELLRDLRENMYDYHRFMTAYSEEGKYEMLSSMMHYYCLCRLIQMHSSLFILFRQSFDYLCGSLDHLADDYGEVNDMMIREMKIYYNIFKKGYQTLLFTALLIKDRRNSLLGSREVSQPEYSRGEFISHSNEFIRYMTVTCDFCVNELWPLWSQVSSFCKNADAEPLEDVDEANIAQVGCKITSRLICAFGETAKTEYELSKSVFRNVNIFEEFGDPYMYIGIDLVNILTDLWCGLNFNLITIDTMSIRMKVPEVRETLRQFFDNCRKQSADLRRNIHKLQENNRPEFEKNLHLLRNSLTNLLWLLVDINEISLENVNF